MCGPLFPEVVHTYLHIYIIINKCLTWDEHINPVCNKTYGKLRLLWTVTDFPSTELRHKLF